MTARRLWFWVALVLVPVVAACSAIPSATATTTGVAGRPDALEPRIQQQRTPTTLSVQPSGGDRALPPMGAVRAATTEHGSKPDQWHALWQRPDFGGEPTVDLRAVGDIMLGRGVERAVRRHGASWLLEPAAELLRGDVVVGNLESPFVRERRPERLRRGPFRLPADPALVDRLKPFTALSLANNHALDAGPAGLADARQTLSAAGIVPLGIRGGACDSATPAATINPAIRLLAYNLVRDPEDRADEGDHCGRAWLDAQALEHVSALRKESPAPIVVLVHWGEEYAARPSDEQRRWAKELVAAGADLVVGAHPHVVQPAEPISAGGRKGFVAYSLGNWVFDQSDKPATSHAVVLRARFDRDGLADVAVAPVAIEQGRPIPLALNDPAARSQISAIAPEQGTHGKLRAWRWDGATFVPVAVPPGTVLPPPGDSLEVDLHGDGTTLRASVRDGVAEVREGDRLLWRNEAPDWNVAGIAAGDADNDGRYEVLLRLWKPGPEGQPRSHPFLVGWRGGRYRVFWGGSPVASPIQDARIGSFDGARNVLVVLEGGSRPGDLASHVGVWSWTAWTFAEQWQSARGAYRQLALIDLDHDGRPEIVAREGDSD